MPTHGNSDWRKINSGNIFQCLSPTWHASEITFLLNTGDSDIGQIAFLRTRKTDTNFSLVFISMDKTVIHLLNTFLYLQRAQGHI